MTSGKKAYWDQICHFLNYNECVIAMWAPGSDFDQHSKIPTYLISFFVSFSCELWSATYDQITEIKGKYYQIRLNRGIFSNKDIILANMYIGTK